MDPLAEKYYSVSPYAFCSGNPVNFAIKREQNELAHFAEREQRKARRDLTLRLSESRMSLHYKFWKSINRKDYIQCLKMKMAIGKYLKHR